MTSINSSSGTLDSSAATPFPCKLRLNRPSLPNTADERFFLATTLLFTFASQARNMPSSIVIPAGPHLPMSARIIYLYVGSNTRQPSPTYSGLTAVSFVTAPLSAFPRKFPIPFTPDVACTLPPIHCMAPAWIIAEWSLSISITTCLLLTFILLMKYSFIAFIGETLASCTYSSTWKFPILFAYFLFSFCKFSIRIA